MTLDPADKSGHNKPPVDSCFTHLRLSLVFLPK
jgi:hypothetical protein